MSKEIKSNSELYLILEDLQDHIFGLHNVQKEASEKFIRELMKELKEAYETIDNLNKLIDENITLTNKSTTIQ